MGESRNLSVGGAPFALDATKRDEPWKGRRVFGRRNEAGAAALETVVGLVRSFS
jgi:hypothetical protein